MGLFAGITLAAKVVVQPLEPAMAMLFAPRESTFVVRPVPLFVVVVVYRMQSSVTGEMVGEVEQLCAVPEPEESAQVSGTAMLCAVRVPAA
jgi:hypothetical protein